MPRTWSSPLGGEREVVTGVALSLDFVHRKFNNQYEVNETNRIWTNTGNRLYQSVATATAAPRTSATWGRPTAPSGDTTASPSA